MNTYLSAEEILAEELSHLNTRIEQTRRRYEELEDELRVVEAELETFADDRRRFDALRDVCASLDKLGELKAQDLFWEGVPDAPGHMERAKKRVAGFQRQISGVLGKQASLQEQINFCGDELVTLNEEVRDAYDRDERRQEEYAVERDISAVPDRPSMETESERRYRKVLLVVLSFTLVCGTLFTLWKLPKMVRPVVPVIPERLVSLLKNERPRPAKSREQRREEKKLAKEQERTPVKQQENRPVETTSETQAARTKAESTGVLAFKESFRDLMDEAPAAKLGAEARLSNPSVVAAGQARAVGRSILTTQSTGGGSGGIGSAGVSRDVGHGNGNRIGGVGFTRVESTVAGLKEGTRPLSSGPGPARTDEEIQIVFDRYKAALYRLYNAELRKNPTLRGKMILRITIEPDGAVSACNVQSSDLASPPLVTQVVERVRKFNFGPKENVSRVTILYPIDFLPGGEN